MKSIKRMLAMFAVFLCLTFAAEPVVQSYAATVQTESQVSETTTENTENDEEAFMFIMMGGALLIILFAVISAMATVSSSIAVAANMDVDGE
jgi:hypothetical protein